MSFQPNLTVVESTPSNPCHSGKYCLAMSELAVYAGLNGTKGAFAQANIGPCNFATYQVTGYTRLGSPQAGNCTSSVGAGNEESRVEPVPVTYPEGSQDWVLNTFTLTTTYDVGLGLYITIDCKHSGGGVLLYADDFTFDVIG
jgi:hypothetical protein